MQVKKFEAPTIQEALVLIKNELGPEAIILSTKQNRKGFGLLSKASVEVTAAISEKALAKKTVTERMMPKAAKQSFEKLPASAQSEIYENFTGYIQERKAENKQKNSGVGAVSAQPKTQKGITSQRYSDIDSDEMSKNEIPAQGYARNGSLPSSKLGALVEGASAGGAYLSSQSMQMGQSQSLSQKSFVQQQQQQPAMNKEMMNEIQRLKNMVAELKSEQTQMADSRILERNSDELSEEFKHLLRNGIEKKFASQLIKHLTFGLSQEDYRNPDKITDMLAVEIMGQLKIQDPLEGMKQGNSKGPAIITLIGSTGVGKTTTIAKIASQAILNKGLKVGLINVDSYKVAALDQMATYAKILNVPFRQASTPAELERALAEFKPLDLVLIDTSGRSQRDSESLSQLKNLLDHAKNAKNLLIMSATTRDQELDDIIKRFKIFNPEGLIFSKLDESTTFGSVYNIAHKTQLPLNYFTVGQRVPEDIELASRERLAALILDL